MGHCISTLNSLHKDNLNKLIFVYLNINSIRKKSELLSEQINNNVNVLLTSEAKLDDNFPDGHFLIEVFCTS